MATRRLTTLLLTAGVVAFLLAVSVGPILKGFPDWLTKQSWSSPTGFVWITGIILAAGAAIALTRGKQHIRRASQIILLISLLAAIGWLARSWQPGDLLHKEHFEPFLAIIGIVLALFASISEEDSPPPGAHGTERQLLRSRQQMLLHVRHDRIDGLLKQSLYQVARIDLRLEDRADIIDRPLTLLVQEAEKPARLLPPRTRIHSVYDDHAAAGGILILGEPGAGKTTLLLELTNELLNRATADEDHPIPVVFDLSSWAVRRAPLAEWLIDELHQRYGVRRKLAEHWVNSEEILPLLDGLDEVLLSHRDACMKAINDFHSEYSVPIAVCSRLEEYQKLSGLLRMPTAVVVQPLTRPETEEYLERGGPGLSALRAAVVKDPALGAILDTPLMLSIAMLAYQGTKTQMPLEGGTGENRRHHLFAKYVDVMFKRRAKETRFTHEQTLRWLTWLASSMIQLGKSDFQLEALNARWLRGPDEQFHLQGVWILAHALLGGLAAGLGFGMTAGLGEGLIFGLGAGLMFGLGTGLIAKLRADGRTEMKPVDRIRWVRPSKNALSRILFVWLPGGLLLALAFQLHYWLNSRLDIGLFAGLGDGIIGGLVAGLVFAVDSGIFDGMAGVLAAALFLGLTDGLMDSFVPVDIIARSIPNEGTWRSAQNALAVGLPVGLAAGLVLEQLGQLATGQPGLLGVGLGFGLLDGLVKGGAFFLRHWFTRFRLFQYDRAPFLYVPFLEYAVDRIFLRRVGGRYIFVHRLLMEYFASLEEPKEVDPSQPDKSPVTE